MDHEEAHKLHHESEEHQNSIENIKGETRFHISLIIFIAIGIFFLASIFAIGYFLIKSQKSLEQIKNIDNPPTPAVYSAHSELAFKELTIPFLSEREYESSLTSLEEDSNNSNYTSYLTSYTSDGFLVNGLLTRPDGQMPAGGFPAIIFVHGYIPPANYVTTSNYSAYVDYLARNGFVVFKIDLRGHGNSEGEASGAYYSGDYIVDVLSAKNALSKLDFVNPERIGLWGHSMAGNVTFRSFVADRNIPAIVIWAGAVYTYEDWQEFGLNDNSYRPPEMSSERLRTRRMLFDAHGEFDNESPFWKMVVPTNYLEGLSGAIQLNHAVNDDVVDIGYSRGLAEILENYPGIEFELNEYQSGGHNISGTAFNEAMQSSVRFFEENL